MWARIVNTIMGIWMLFAPTILGYQKAASNNAYIVGSLITTVAIISMAESVREVRKINWFLGAWLIVAPWILTYRTGISILNDIFIGILVMFFSSFRGNVKEKFGGGWKSAFRP